MRKGFGFHDRHSPFRFNPATLFLGGTVQGAWYDPTDLSTLFQDAAGTVPVTAVGQSVRLMLDKSGKGNNTTAPSDAARPTLQIDSNGLLHLLFDGINDSMSTAAIDLSGTNKLSLFAGITKAEDNATRQLLETSANINLNAGAINFRAPTAAATPNVAWNARGSTNPAFVTSPSTYAAPVTMVVTATADIGAPQRVLRINGGQVAASTDSMGTGNFGNYSLFIASRNNAGSYFSGRIYGLIVLGAAASSWQIQVTEQWMAGKTGLQF